MTYSGKHYRVTDDMEDEIVKKTVAEVVKTKKPASKQSVFEKIFWLGVANETKKK